MMESEVRHYSKRRGFPAFVLGGDIGGTNVNLGIAGVKDNKITLLFSMHFKTRRRGSAAAPIKEILDYAKEEFGIGVRHACIAGAGPVSSNHDFCRLTNAALAIDAKDIMEKTALSSVFVINDFEAIGYGVNLLDSKPARETMAVLGPGTGLGKSILVYNKACDACIPVPSEGGHSNFPAQNKLELELINSIRKTKKIRQVSYEDIISGPGIESIYLFLRARGKKATKYTEEIDKAEEKAPLIAKYRAKDPVCRETFRLFARFCGRCARNFALDVLPRGGLYIAGGIALRNPEIFKSQIFKEEFADSQKRKDLLGKIPVHVISEPNIGLLGACLVAVLHTAE